ncbi:pilus assembly protein [Colwellia sp. BRX10-3]|uniref:TadE family protein n=1 Tax=Colwellia sp. BRX10-3 TaxID=2759844 RepID=UPI0015F5E409|nr:TadE family protein [Colwellia sp. BRX10-3]MBA6390709.1 pilus assembly protein [Colwellia sp. BRX10-3]
MKNIGTHFKKQQGLAAIEFTLVLPFLLLLIFASAEFGRLLYQYNALNKTVRDASRHLSSNVKFGDTGNITIKDSVSAEVKSLIQFGQISSANALFPNLSDEDISLAISGDFIVVTVNYDWQPIFSQTFTTFGLGNDIDLSFPLVSTYTMRAL